MLFRSEDGLRALGFVNDTGRDAPICRWRYGGIMVDVVPSDKAILGFANRWYPLGLKTAQPITLPSGIAITAINAPCFCATKLEAFADRGNTSAGEPDFLGSHDLGDLIAVVDGRASLLLEIEQSDIDLKKYLAERASQFVNSPKFMRSIEGHLQPDAVSQLRAPAIRATFHAMAALKTNLTTYDKLI